MKCNSILNLSALITIIFHRIFMVIQYGISFSLTKELSLKQDTVFT
jgi:hypothetical protein